MIIIFALNYGRNELKKKFRSIKKSFQNIFLIGVSRLILFSSNSLRHPRREDYKTRFNGEMNITMLITAKWMSWKECSMFQGCSQSIHGVCYELFTVTDLILRDKGASV